MRVPRFRVESLHGQMIRVDGPEARHGLRVLRLAVGRPVVLFDGSGREAAGRIVAVSRASFEVELGEIIESATRPTSDLTIAAAIPKGDRADWLVEKCAELGVTALSPLLCERSVVRPGDAKLDRLRRKATEAAKQSGRAVEMRITAPSDLPALIAGLPPGAILNYGDPRGARRSWIECLLSRPSTPRLVEFLCIGPEGGFSEAECHILESADAEAVRLSDAVLRVETAAVAAAAAWGIVRRSTVVESATPQ